MSHYYLFLLTSVVAVAIPGPDFLLVVQTSLRRGKREGVLSAVGIASGLCVHGIFATIGLSALLLKSAQAFEIVKWMGALYLVFLAVQLIRDLVQNRQGNVLSDEMQSDMAQHIPSHRYVLRGFLTNVLNIKAALFFVAILPQFVVGDTHVGLQLALLSFTQVVVAMIWFSVLAIAVNRLGVFLKRRVVQRWLDGATASIFLALAAKLASTSRT